MSGVTLALRAKMLVAELEAVVYFLNNELIPVVQEIRTRFNQRHGRTLHVTADTGQELDHEFVVFESAAALTYTLLSASLQFRTLGVKNKGSANVTIAALSGETIEGVASVNVIPNMCVQFSPDYTVTPPTWHVVGTYP